jgi:hypothetical protein
MTDLGQRIAEAEAEYDEARRDWLAARAKKDAARQRRQALYRERVAVNQAEHRERAIARFAKAALLKGLGMPQKEIASTLGISVATLNDDRKRPLREAARADYERRREEAIREREEWNRTMQKSEKPF